MGALSPLLCISFGLHKIGAILWILKGERGQGEREEEGPVPSFAEASASAKASADVSAGRRLAPLGARSGFAPLIGCDASKSCSEFTPHVSTRVPARQVYLVSYYSNRSRGRASAKGNEAQESHPFPAAAGRGLATEKLKGCATRVLPRQFWQRRFHDFNVWSHKKKIEKLEYMHLNPVKNKLVRHPISIGGLQVEPAPEDSPWSGYSHYGKGAEGLVKINDVP